MTHNFITCLGIWPCTVCLWHLRLTYFYNALPCLCAPSVNTDCHNVFAQDICQGTKWEHRMNTKQTCSLAFIVSGYQDQTDTFVCLSVWLYQSIMCWKFTGFRQCTTVCICLGELFWKFLSFFFFPMVLKLSVHWLTLLQEFVLHYLGEKQTETRSLRFWWKIIW